MSKNDTAAASAAAKPPAKRKRIVVRAMRMGFYDLKRRREGNTFKVYEDEFTATWMERVDDRTPEVTTTGQQELERQRREILAAKGASASPDDDTL